MQPLLSMPSIFWADAIEKAGTTDRAAIRDALAKTKDFDALTGFHHLYRSG